MSHSRVHSGPSRRGSWPYALLLAVASLACDRPPQDLQFDPGSPFEPAATFRTADGSVHLTLAQPHPLATAVDLSVFGPLHPGMTRDEAMALLGAPATTELDMFGEPWSVWHTPLASLKVGCRYECSGSTPQDCRWSLEADVGNPPALLTPPTTAALSRAQSPTGSAGRRLLIQAGTETVDLELTSPGVVVWHDRRRDNRRVGPPPIGKCP